MIYAKLIAAAALIAGLWWAYHTISAAFEERDQLRLDNKALSTEVAGLRQHAVDELESGQRIAQVNEKLDGIKESLLGEIRKGGLTHEVAAVEGKCHERDLPRYRSLFNAAVEGTATAAPASVPDAVPSQ